MRIGKRWLPICLNILALAALPVLAQSQATPAPSRGTLAAPAAPTDPGLYMTFQTTMGDITCQLYEKEAPLAVHTIVGLALGRIPYTDPKTHMLVRGKHFYDGLTFHRVIPEFMIQGGDPLGNGTGNPIGPQFPFKNETAPGLMFDRPGRLALANVGNDHSNGSQFFITEVAYPSLNGMYTLFGQCNNQDVVKAIARVPRDGSDKPRTPVVIKRVVVQRVGPVPPNAPEGAPRAAVPARAATTKAPARAPAK